MGNPMRDQERSPEETIREALREALRLRNEAYVSTPVRDDTRNAHFALQALGQILREALRAEPAKEEA